MSLQVARFHSFLWLNNIHVCGCITFFFNLLVNGYLSCFHNLAIADSTELHRFLNVEPALHNWNKSHLVIVYNIFYRLLSLICYFLRFFYIYVHKRYWFIDFLFFNFLGFDINILLV